MLWTALALVAQMLAAAAFLAYVLSDLDSRANPTRDTGFALLAATLAGLSVVGAWRAFVHCRSAVARGLVIAATLTTPLVLAAYLGI